MLFRDLIDRPLMKMPPNRKGQALPGFGERIRHTALAAHMPGTLEASFTANGSSNHMKDDDQRRKKAASEVMPAFITNLLDRFMGKKLPYRIQLTGLNFFSHGLKFLSSSFDTFTHHKGLLVGRCTGQRIRSIHRQQEVFLLPR